jgi:tRNA pseudouridine38-40 synthase
MVRIMAGTLLYVCSGKIMPQDIPAIIESKDRSRAGITAPPDGLYLNKVYFSGDNYEG